ncbi:hypothetical protein BS50DRAFT_118979 [Corynespora cassiicola Philippines]|uniref:Uncharacterized protein n=1 Tax=Corynespora cassiicola Philippines TaxID=1448308 RepID=A0A2T2NAH5_CORCC|nr:hypothetical protein BS50DRAFT_118979 [Corynespora cassiicola Philippines]
MNSQRSAVCIARPAWRFPLGSGDAPRPKGSVLRLLNGAGTARVRRSCSPQSRIAALGADRIEGPVCAYSREAIYVDEMQIAGGVVHLRPGGEGGNTRPHHRPHHRPHGHKEEPQWQPKRHRHRRGPAVPAVPAVPALPALPALPAVLPQWPREGVSSRLTCRKTSSQLAYPARATQAMRMAVLGWVARSRQGGRLEPG